MIVGIDPSSLTIAIAVLNSSSGMVRYAAKVDLRKKGKAWDPQKAHEVHGVLQDVLLDTIGIGEFDHVFCEEPVLGRSVKPTIVQSYVSGLIQATVSGSMAKLTLVNNKGWKKAVVGNGNASKEDTIAALRARQPGLERICGDDDDLHDAAGLAIYGASTLSREDQS